LQISDLLQAGVVYARAGNTKAARRALARLAQTWKAGPSSWKRSGSKNLEGEIFLADRQPQQAETAFLAADPPFRSYIGLARVYQAQQRWADEVRQWENVLAAKGDILHHEFPLDVLTAHLELARAYRALKDQNRALSHYQEVVRLLRNADDIPSFREAKREAEQFASAGQQPSKTFLRPSHPMGLHYALLHGGHYGSTDHSRERTL
jgi:tetratricopeptide (TPR) repeat protein